MVTGAAPEPNVKSPLKPSHSKYPAAIGAIQTISIPSPSIGPFGDFFFTAPYNANVLAKTSEIQGNEPASKVNTATPTKAIPIASQRRLVKRSPNNTAPSATDINGLTK